MGVTARSTFARSATMKACCAESSAYGWSVSKARKCTRPTSKEYQNGVAAGSAIGIVGELRMRYARKSPAGLWLEKISSASLGQRGRGRGR